MNRIDKKFIELKKRGKKALIVFINRRDFGLSTTKKLIIRLAESGADIIELGVPFSDPIADGLQSRLRPRGRLSAVLNCGYNKIGT